MTCEPWARTTFIPQSTRPDLGRLQRAPLNTCDDEQGTP